MLITNLNFSIFNASKWHHGTIHDYQSTDLSAIFPLTFQKSYQWYQVSVQDTSNQTQPNTNVVNRFYTIDIVHFHNKNNIVALSNICSTLKSWSWFHLKKKHIFSDLCNKLCFRKTYWFMTPLCPEVNRNEMWGFKITRKQH